MDALTEIEHRKRTPGPSRVAQPAPSRDALFRDPDYSRAVAAAYRRQWSEAVALFMAVQQRFPTDERVRTPLAEAKASDAEARGEWYEAVTALDALAAVRPGDQTIQNRRARAGREVEIGDLVGQLRALAAAEEWAGVVAIESANRSARPAAGQSRGPRSHRERPSVRARPRQPVLVRFGRARPREPPPGVRGLRGDQSGASGLPRGRRPAAHDPGAVESVARPSAGTRTRGVPTPVAPVVVHARDGDDRWPTPAGSGW